MNQKYAEARAEAADCTASLAQAVNAAGGSFDPSILNRTVRDFISEVAAQNNIYFVYMPRPKEPEPIPVKAKQPCGPPPYDPEFDEIGKAPRTHPATAE